MKYLFIIIICLGGNYLPGLEYIESSTGLNNPQMEGGRTELEFADINLDGNIDILSIGDHGSPYINTNEHGIMVWFGDDNCTWSVYQNGNFGYGGIAAGDVNNDGLPDVGYAMHHDYSGTDFGDQLIEVALGDGTGMNWTPWDDGLATNGETWGMFGTDFADVDNDGDLDLGSNSFGSGAGVHVYLNQGDGTWIQSFGFLGGNSSMDFMFGDINNDGFIDFAVNHQSGSVYFGDGTGDFELADNNLPPGGILGRCGISLGDIDNDGGKDLAYITSSGGIKSWLWDEDIQQWIDISGNLPLSGDYEMTQLYDMNTDGFIDLAAFGEGTFTLWLGDGGSNWLQDAQFFTPSYGYCEAFRAGGDIDHNGYADLMLVADEGSWPSDHNHLRCFKENSPAYQLDISAVFPRGNEFFLPGSVQFIDWIAAVPAGDVATITLEYSLEGENGPWSSIATDLPNNGRFQWTIPEFSSSDCFLKYTATTPSASQFAITPCAFTIAAVTDSDDNIMPAAVIELRNCPNPFNPLTTITYSLPQETTVILKIHNIRGQLVRILVSGIKPAGEYQIIWNGKDYDDQPVPSGIYFYQLDTGIGSQIGKMILLR